MKKDITILLGGFLTALLLFLGTIGVSLDWFTQESINAFVVLVGAAIALGINFYSVWKNTFVSKKAQMQKKELQALGLMKRNNNVRTTFNSPKAYEEDGK